MRGNKNHQVAKTVSSMTSSLTNHSLPRVQISHTNHIPSLSLPVILSFPSLQTTRLRALKTESEGEKLRNRDLYGEDSLRKPSVHFPVTAVDFPVKYDDEEENRRRCEQDDEVEWEDKILEDTVPIVGFVRMILHSGKYESGVRLSPEHEKSIIERLLEYHPERDMKIGSGIDYITIGYHPDFEGSRCLFIARKDGELVDFSYWKCIKGLIQKNYPLHAKRFISRHFRKRRHC